MESTVRKLQKRNDYNRYKLFRKIKRRRKAELEQLSKAAEKELKRRLRWTAPKLTDGKTTKHVYAPGSQIYESVDPVTGDVNYSINDILGNEVPVYVEDNTAENKRDWTFRDADGTLFGKHKLSRFDINDKPLKLVSPEFAILTAGRALANGALQNTYNLVKPVLENQAVLNAFAADAAYRQGLTDDGWRKTARLIKEGNYGDAVLSGAGDVLDLTMMAPTAYRGFKSTDELSRELLPTYDYYRTIRETNPTIEQLKPIIENASDYSKSDNVKSIHFNDAKNIQQSTESAPRINLERTNRKVRLKKKLFDDSDFEDDFPKFENEKQIYQLLNNYENLGERDLLRIKKQAESLNANSDLMDTISSKLYNARKTNLLNNTSYHDITYKINSLKNGRKTAYKLFEKDKDVLNKIRNFYEQEYSLGLRDILGDSYDPVLGTWNRDLDVVDKLQNSNKETLLEFYKLLGDHGAGFQTKDLSILLESDKNALDILNGNFVGVHNAMTHNLYGDSSTLIERARLSLMGLDDLGRVEQSTFGSPGQSFSPNSVLINLKGLERTIRNRIKNKLLPVIANSADDAKLNKFGKVKFLDEDGNYTALMGIITEDLKKKALMSMVRKKGGPVLLDPKTGEPIKQVGDYGLYKPTLQELDSEKFQTIDEYLDQIKTAYQRVINAYNDLIKAFPNIFTESDRLLFNPEDLLIIEGKFGRELDDAIPTIKGPSYMFRMNKGKDFYNKFAQPIFNRNK